MWKWSPTSVDDSLREWQASNWGAFAESVLSFRLSGEPLADDDYELASPPAASIHASDSPAMKRAKGGLRGGQKVPISTEVNA